MSNGTVYFLPNTLIVNKGKLVSFVKRGEERTETRQSASVLVAQLGCGPCLLRFVVCKRVECTENEQKSGRTHEGWRTVKSIAAIARSCVDF